MVHSESSRLFRFHVERGQVQGRAISMVQPEAGRLFEFHVEGEKVQRTAVSMVQSEAADTRLKPARRTRRTSQAGEQKKPNPKPNPNPYPPKAKRVATAERQQGSQCNVRPLPLREQHQIAAHVVRVAAVLLILQN